MEQYQLHHYVIFTSIMVFILQIIIITDTVLSQSLLGKKKRTIDISSNLCGITGVVWNS